MENVCLAFLDWILFPPFLWCDSLYVLQYSIFCSISVSFELWKLYFALNTHTFCCLYYNETYQLLSTSVVTRTTRCLFQFYAGVCNLKLHKFIHRLNTPCKLVNTSKCVKFIQFNRWTATIALSTTIVSLGSC